MAETVKKYKINALLDSLNVAQRRKALEILPEVSLLDISQATLNNYRAINVGDLQDIPYAKVLMLEQFFGIPEGTLRNFEVNVKPFRELYQDEMEIPLTQKINLIKP